MKFNQALGQVIRDERTRRGMTLRDVTEKVFMSYGHLSDVERGQKEASSIFIERIAEALEMEAYEIILEAGYKMAGEKIPDNLEDFIGEGSFTQTTPVN